MYLVGLKVRFGWNELAGACAGRPFETAWPSPKSTAHVYRPMPHSIPPNASRQATSDTAVVLSYTKPCI